MSSSDYTSLKKYTHVNASNANNETAARNVNGNGIFTNVRAFAGDQ